MNAYEAYQRYLAFKFHFTSPNYDIIKYGGKVNASPQAFDRRKDKYFFHKLSRQDDVDSILVAFFVETNDPSKAWIGNILSKKDEYYNRWLRRQESITYLFKSDLEIIGVPLTTEQFRCEEGQHPFVLKLFLQKKIAIETLIILDSVMGIFDVWNKHIEEKIIWPSVYQKCIKYKPFVKYDQERINKILVELEKV